MTRTFEQTVREYVESLRQDDHQSKEGIRRVLLGRKLDNLLQLRDDLKKIEGKCLSLLSRVDYADIDPAMVFSSPKDRPVWNYLRHVLSSAPHQDRPGRALFLFCVDRRSKGIMGIVDVGSDLATLGPRDRHIGWKMTDRLTGGGLRFLANMGTCVAVHPFGILTGGKFMSEAVSSRNMAQIWKRRYGDPLAGITTTSLYGKSSQYNRIPHYAYLGTTDGTIGTGHISTAGHRMFVQFLKSRKFQTTHGRHGTGGGPGGGFTNRLNSFIHVCDILGLDPSEYSAKQPRGVYFAEYSA
jgi:hypothetical protein